MSIENKFYELSELLYNNDPAGTCCVENEMIDEYDTEAFYILKNEKITDFESVSDYFNTRFDGEYDPEILKAIYPTIKRIIFS